MTFANSEFELDVSYPEVINNFRSNSMLKYTLETVPFFLRRKSDLIYREKYIWIEIYHLTFQIKVHNFMPHRDILMILKLIISNSNHACIL